MVLISVEVIIIRALSYPTNDMLTIFSLMDYLIHIDTISFELSIWILKSCQLNFLYNFASLCLKNVLILANSADTDEMPH